MDSSTFLITLAASVMGSSVLAALVTAWAMRKKTSAEADSTISEVILKYTDKLTSDNDKLREAINVLEVDLDKAKTKLIHLRKDLDAAEEHAKSLKEIVAALEARKENDKVIISKLVTALRQSDPDNPLLKELMQLSEFKLSDTIPPSPSNS